MAEATLPPNFVRDPHAGAHLAAQFGAGAGNAEALIEANDLAHGPELTAANDLPIDLDRTADLDYADVAEAAGLDESQIRDAAVRGPYVTYVAVYGDRLGKGVFHFDKKSGELTPVDDGADPRRARIAAQVQAAGIVREAEAKAAKLIADAQAEAAKVQAKAVTESNEAQAQPAEEDEAEAESTEATDPDDTPDADEAPGGADAGDDDDARAKAEAARAAAVGAQAEAARQVSGDAAKSTPSRSRARSK